MQLAKLRLLALQGAFGQHIRRDVDGHHHGGLTLEKLDGVQGEVHKNNLAGSFLVPHHTQVVVSRHGIPSGLEHERQVLGGSNVPQGHLQELFMRIAIVVRGGLVHRQKAKRLPVIHPHRFGMLHEQVARMQFHGIGPVARIEYPPVARIDQKNQSQGGADDIEHPLVSLGRGQPGRVRRQGGDESIRSENPENPKHSVEHTDAHGEPEPMRRPGCLHFLLHRMLNGYLPEHPWKRPLFRRKVMGRHFAYKAPGWIRPCT